MFKGIGNIAQMLKQAQEMSGKMAEANDGLKSKRFTIEVGGGMVKIEANGLGETRKVSIDPDLFQRGEQEMIEDLLVAAFNQVSIKAKQLHMESMREMTAGVNLPGLDQALEKLSGQFPDADDD
jgi:DNA-binding YbaB/EbfC family protein